MTDGLREKDAKALGDAIGILRAAGYEVRTNEAMERTADGVTFDLHVHAPTNYEHFNEQVNAMKAVAIDTPDVGFGGGFGAVKEDEEEDDG